MTERIPITGSLTFREDHPRHPPSMRETTIWWEGGDIAAVAVCTECPEPEAVIDAALAKANASLDEAMRRSIDTVGGLREPTDREGDVAEGAD